MTGAGEVMVAGEGEGSEEVVDMRGGEEEVRRDARKKAMSGEQEGMVRGKVEVNGKRREENTR